MPPRGWRLRIGDVIKAAATIRSYVQDQSFQSFSANGMMIDAVVRNLEIIGEAARHVPADIQDRYSSIPWIDMRAMRNATATVTSKLTWKWSGTPFRTISHH